MYLSSSSRYIIVLVHRRFSGFLGFMVLNGIIDIAEDGADALFFLNVESKEGDHAKVVDELSDGSIQFFEGSATHQVRWFGGIIVVILLVVMIDCHVGIDMVVLGMISAGSVHCGMMMMIIVEKKGMIRFEKSLQFLPTHVVLDQIHLAENVDMR